MINFGLKYFLILNNNSTIFYTNTVLGYGLHELLSLVLSFPKHYADPFFILIDTLLLLGRAVVALGFK